MENEMEKENAYVSLDNLLSEERRLHDDQNPVSPSICCIPPTIASLITPSPYRDYIQLGPLHKEINNTFHDRFKRKYMYDLFQRLKHLPQNIWLDPSEKVVKNISEIKAYYDNVGNFNDHALALLIIVDSCYILELIQKCSELENNNSSSNKLFPLDLKHDLVRLDNQIPFFVLQDIFECTILKLNPSTPSLPKLVLAFLKDIIPFEANIVIDDHQNIKFKHILDLIYQCYKPTNTLSSDLLSRVTTMFSATELAKAGVKFNPNQDDKLKIDMKFRSSWGNATLTMPTIRIDESTAPLLCNLATYEQSFPDVGNYITSYVFAMKMLLDTKEDVLKLVESKICRNSSGHQYIIDLVHGLCKGVVLTEFLYAKHWQQMGKYCNSRLGWTRRTYFSGAWSYIASISGLILFILTAIQTYSSIRTLEPKT